MAGTAGGGGGRGKAPESHPVAQRRGRPGRDPAGHEIRRGPLPWTAACAPGRFRRRRSGRRSGRSTARWTASAPGWSRARRSRGSSGWTRRDWAGSTRRWRTGPGRCTPPSPGWNCRRASRSVSAASAPMPSPRRETGCPCFPPWRPRKPSAERCGCSICGLEPKLRERLDKLAVYTVGDFLALPGERIARHLGEQARGHSTASRRETGPCPFSPGAFPNRSAPGWNWTRNESDARGLQFRVSQLLAPLLKAAGERYQAAAALRLAFRQENGTRHRCRIQAAEPTLDARDPAGAGGPAPGNGLLPLPPGGTGPRGGGRGRHRRQAEPPAGESGPRHRLGHAGPGAGPGRVRPRFGPHGPAGVGAISRKPVSGGSPSASSPRPPPGRCPCGPWCAAPTPVPGSWKASP